MSKPVEYDSQMRRLSERLGYTFSHPELLRDALTHKSYANERPKLAPHNNERLEFLGDSALGFVVSRLLFRAYPTAPEGELTRRRASIVCEAGLASIADEIELGPCLRLGKGEERTGGREKPRLLSSALEAVLGAVLMDGGAEALTEVGERLFAPSVKGALADATKDHKSLLQERLQRQRGPLPRYTVTAMHGPDHERIFDVSLSVRREEIARGSGKSKMEAEQDAAQKALARWSDIEELLLPIRES